MSNKHRGEYEITLCGEVLQLRMTFDALVEFEETAGASVFKVVDGMQKMDLPAKVVAAAIWAGHRGEHEDKSKCYSLSKIGEMAMRHGIPTLVLPVFEFLSMSLASDDQINEMTKKVKKEEDGA